MEAQGLKKKLLVYRKALKVIELKDLLTKAGVAIPAKANKPDLIAKIIETPAALQLFESSRGGGGGGGAGGGPW